MKPALSIRAPRSDFGIFSAEVVDNVCHTWRESGAGAAGCRIISACKATKAEARQYRQKCA